MPTKGLTKRTEKFNDLLQQVPATYAKNLHLHEYMLVMPPHQELKEKIKKAKQHLADTYQNQTALHVPVHVMLARFSTWEMLEDKLLPRLRQIAGQTAPFKVNLSNYGSFPTHSVVINVTTKLPIMQLVAALRTAQKLMKANPESDPHFITEPHLVVGTKLLPWQYEKAWQEYSHRQFSGTFIGSHMLLLKRAAGEKAWQIKDRLSFENLPIESRQANLFG